MRKSFFIETKDSLAQAATAAMADHQKKCISMYCNEFLNKSNQVPTRMSRAYLYNFFFSFYFKHAVLD